jgi:hypothetical protein
LLDDVIGNTHHFFPAFYGGNNSNKERWQLMRLSTRNLNKLSVTDDIHMILLLLLIDTPGEKLHGLAR